MNHKIIKLSESANLHLVSHSNAVSITGFFCFYDDNAHALLKSWSEDNDITPFRSAGVSDDDAVG